MKAAVDTRMLSDCHCEERGEGGCHNVKGWLLQTHWSVGHDAGSLQFAPVRNVKILVVVTD